ncbi:MAG: indolepyruvate oxidoreductase subunit beta [Desulfovibrionaceae bacterium]|nr:indolepyruvate oxidoreductase subunit beta [Desulfovibrionaceae bacterium]
MSNNQRLRVYFTGVGGQGTLTATNLLARTALMVGLDVVAGEVHGMAQRGGVVESVLLLGGLKSPRLDLGEADVILGFEPLETLRGLPYLHKGGTVISSSNPLPPLSVALGQAKYPDLATIKANVTEVASRSYFVPCRDLGLLAGAIQSGNTVLLACACAAHVFPFDLEALAQGIKTFLPAKIQASNLKALELGAQEYEKLAAEKA